MRSAPIKHHVWVRVILLVAIIGSIVTGTSTPVHAVVCPIEPNSNGLREVASENDLELLTTDDCADGDFIQTVDIVIGASWNPGDTAFSGSYNGDNRSITVTGVNEFGGVFPIVTGAHIHNVTVASASSTLAEDFSGGPGWLVGADWHSPENAPSEYEEIEISADLDIPAGIGLSRNGGMIGLIYRSSVVIRESNFSGHIDAVGGPCPLGAGGLVGMIDEGYQPGQEDRTVTITRSSASGFLACNEAGGLIGFIQNTAVHIEDSYSSGNISGDWAGGLVGKLDAESPITISNSYSSGLIEGDGAGGLIGGLGQSGCNECSLTITDSYSSGLIEGDEAGGLIGGYGQSGCNECSLTITDSYSSGLIEGDEAGGLIGGHGQSDCNQCSLTITDSYSQGDISGLGAGGLVGLGLGDGCDDCLTTVVGSRSTGDIQGDGAGGLIGGHGQSDCNQCSLTITDSYSQGDISGLGAGGLVGLGLGDGCDDCLTTVVGSRSTGDIQGEGAGGIVGKSPQLECQTSCTMAITYSYATGVIEGAGAGGIVGGTPNFGCVGVCELTIDGSFASGAIAGDGAGGIFGSYSNKDCDSSSSCVITVRDSFSLGTITIDNPQGGGVTGEFPNGQCAGSCQIEILRSFSLGDIEGDFAAGLLGSQPNTQCADSCEISVRESFSTGRFVGSSASGIAGRDTNKDCSGNCTVTIEKSYTTGEIQGSYRAGIVGIDSNSGCPASSGICTLSVNNSYSSGAISDGGAGTVGLEAEDVVVESNTYAADANWSDVDAIANLVGYPAGIGEGTVWGQCEVNTPYFLVAFYSLNPCEDAPDRAVTVSNIGDVSPTSIGGRSFTLVKEYSSATTPTFISIVNGTGSVSMDGVDCDYLLSCRVTDFVSTGGSAKSNFSVGSTGTVIVKRLNADGTIVDLDVVNIRGTTRSRALTVTLDPAGGACGEHSTPWTITQRRSVTLPTATDCTRDGYTLLGWTRDPANTAPENLLHNTISRSGTVTAVWGKLPNPPTAVFVLRDFLCNKCGNALVIWQTTDTEITGFTVTVDDTPTTCTPTTLGTWRLCGVSGLTPNEPHTFGVSIQYTNGTSSTTTKTTQ